MVTIGQSSSLPPSSQILSLDKREPELMVVHIWDGTDLPPTDRT